MPSASEVPVLDEYERLLFYVVAYAQLSLRTTDSETS